MTPKILLSCHLVGQLDSVTRSYLVTLHTKHHMMSLNDKPASHDAIHQHDMTKCVQVLRAEVKAKGMDQSQARIRADRVLSKPVIGPCFLLLLLLATLRRTLTMGSHDRGGSCGEYG